MYSQMQQKGLWNTRNHSSHIEEKQSHNSSFRDF